MCYILVQQYTALVSIPNHQYNDVMIRSTAEIFHLLIGDIILTINLEVKLGPRVVNFNMENPHGVYISYVL